ncbi:MAG TPA: hypothetical protein DIS90_12455 [Cytophagales bacterium]|nr:hypothetical protein [Cytophagales bacterium]HCR54511.1 hypothetical protein [Cytophagales bacterium]
MKKNILALIVCSLISSVGFSQSRESGTEIQTLFKNNPVRTSGGYGAISNKFTTIKGEYANLVEMYGGWYINQRFMLGLSGGATTNNIPVPFEYAAIPGERLSYEYGQFGLATEYVLGSNRTFHIVFHLMTGAGFTVQYDRYNVWETSNGRNHVGLDENWFFVAEPEIQLEVNVFKWMRFSPGYSYRSVYGSDAAGLRDEDLSGSSFNLTLKFGKF